MLIYFPNEKWGIHWPKNPGFNMFFTQQETEICKKSSEKKKKKLKQGKALRNCITKRLIQWKKMTLSAHGTLVQPPNNAASGDENVDVQISPENMYWMLLYMYIIVYYRCEMNVIIENVDFRVLEI